MRTLLLISIIVILVPNIFFTIIYGSSQLFNPVSASHSNHQTKACKYPYSTLYVFTEPVQKQCSLLEHNGVPINASSGEPFGKEK